MLDVRLYHVDGTLATGWGKLVTPIDAVAGTPDGQYIISVAEAVLVYVWSVATKSAQEHSRK